MIDIMLMLSIAKYPVVFVGKKELEKIPIFGYLYRRVAILVDRSSPESRKRVYEKSKKRLDKGLSVCIFPEGGVPEPSIILDQFKNGAFSLAVEFQIPIVPMTFLDCEKKFPYFFAYLIIKDSRTGEQVINEKLFTESKFEDVAVRFRGDRRAICANDIGRLKDVSLPIK